MIELKLSEFFGVLGVGSFVIISIVYFNYLLTKLFNVRRHNNITFLVWMKAELSKSHKDTALAIGAVLAVYCSGVLIQDVTDHLKDSKTSFNKVVQFVEDKVGLLQDESELRKDVLIKDGKKLTPLGREVFDSAARILNTKAPTLDFFNNNTPAAIYWEKNGKNILCKYEDSLMRFVDKIYYTSKNWCYIQSEPVRKELESIQERIDFARSILIVAFFDFSLIVLFYLCYYIRERLKPKADRFIVVKTRRNGRSSNEIRHFKVFKPFLAFGIIGGIIIITQTGFVAAEKNFNERAMGYYVSQFKFQKEKAGDEKSSAKGEVIKNDSNK